MELEILTKAHIQMKLRVINILSAYFTRNFPEILIKYIDQS